LTAARI